MDANAEAEGVVVCGAGKLGKQPSLSSQVWWALSNAGEAECRTRVTRTTRRVRYVPGERGFRLCLAIDPMFVSDKDCSTDRWYLGVGTVSKARKVLEGYAAILRKAGFDVQIDRTYFRKRLRVWVTVPVDNRVGS